VAEQIYKVSPRPSRLKAIWRAALGIEGTTPITPIISTSSSAGKSVTLDTAMGLATVWACSRLLAETTATLPLMLYEADQTGARRVARSEGLFALLHDAPHYDFTAVEFWEGITLSLVLNGNAYARKEYIGPRLVALTPLRADLMQVHRDQSGARFYRYSDSKGSKDYPENEIFHVRGFGGAGDVGLSTISFARQSLGTAMAADEFAAKMFANGTRPTGILTVDQVLTAEQREQIRDNIVAPYVGSDNAGGLMVLEAAMKFMPVTMTPEDSQFLQTRAFHVEEICRWFRVPPFMVGHAEKSTSWGTGIEQQMIGFVTFALRPYLARIEQAISRALIPAQDRQRLKPEFKVEGLLRTDSKARADFYMLMVQNGIMTRNEVRRLENLEPLADADQLTVQSQNVPLGQTADQAVQSGA
jgi:HK97 family phage portal protein